jgi:hypothetical protein
MATINHERKRVINAIRLRVDSKRRPHIFNIGKLDETLGKKPSARVWLPGRRISVPRIRIVKLCCCGERQPMDQISKVSQFGI